MEVSKDHCDQQDMPEIITVKEIKPNPQKMQSNSHNNSETNSPKIILDLDHPRKHIILEKIDFPATNQVLEINQLCPPGEENLSVEAQKSFKESGSSTDSQVTKSMENKKMEGPENMGDFRKSGTGSLILFDDYDEIDITEEHGLEHRGCGYDQEKTTCNSGTRNQETIQINVTKSCSPSRSPIQTSTSKQNQENITDAENALKIENNALKMENHALRADNNNLKEQNKLISNLREQNKLIKIQSKYSKRLMKYKITALKLGKLKCQDSKTAQSPQVAKEK